MRMSNEELKTRIEEDYTNAVENGYQDTLDKLSAKDLALDLIECGDYAGVAEEDVVTAVYELRDAGNLGSFVGTGEE